MLSAETRIQDQRDKRIAELEEENQLLRKAMRIAQTLSHTGLEYQRIGKLLTRKLSEMFPSSDALIHTISDDKLELSASAQGKYSGSNPFCSARCVSDCPALSNELVVLSDSLSGKGGCPRKPQNGNNESNPSYICIGLVAGKERLGVLSLESKSDTLFDCNRLEVLLSIANQAALAIQRNKLQETLLKEQDLRKQDLAMLEQNVQEQTEELSIRNLELELANRELETFVYSVSHDLKAPLVSLQGISQMLMEDYYDLLDATGKRYLARLQANAHHMEQLIQGLLELSRIGRISDPLTEVDPVEVIREVLDQFYFQIAERRITVHLQEPLPRLYCERTRLFQVFSNLISNAIKFLGADNTEPRIEIGGRQLEGEVEFYVRDNGIGIDEQYHQKIFGVFQRLQEVQGVEGTGIGLTIVQKIIEKHGGRVWVHSRKNQGATFFFTIATPKQRRLKDRAVNVDR